jgi:hypothetical protein
LCLLLLAEAECVGSWIWIIRDVLEGLSNRVG